MCRVTVAGGPHPSSPRHPRHRLCDLHFDDFTRAKNRWKKARERYVQGPDSREDPGDWDTYQRSIGWTRIDRVYVLTDPDVREQLREVADDLKKARDWMTRWSETPRLWQRLHWEGFHAQALTYDEYLNSAILVLRRLGEEPE